MFTARVLRNDFARLASGMKGNADRIMRESAERVAADWSAGVRVSPGDPVGREHLRDSIQAYKRGDGWAAGTEAEHAVHEEFGTRYMRGSHAAAQAVSRERDLFFDALARGVLPK